MMDAALLVLRLAAGLGVAAHGAQKLFGWWSGPGWGGTRELVARLRFQPPEAWRLAVVAAELGGGLLLALGLLTPLGSLGVIAAMAVAALTVHAEKGFFSQKGGWELPVVGYAVPALVILIAGPGAVSLDRALGTALPEPLAGIAGVLLVVLVVGFALGTREVAAAEVTGEVLTRPRAQHPSETAGPRRV
jgi:putative oxidoreductase